MDHELPTHVSMRAVGAFLVLWRTTHWCGVSTMSGVIIWIFPICKFPLCFLTCPLKLQYINVTSWPWDFFLSCTLHAAVVAPRAELPRAMQEASLRQLPVVGAPWRTSELKQSPRSEMGLTDREMLRCHLLLSLPRWPRSKLPFLFWARIWKYCIDATHSVYDFGLWLSDELRQAFRKIRVYNNVVVLFYDL